jgi:TolB-like protein
MKFYVCLLFIGLLTACTSTSNNSFYDTFRAEKPEKIEKEKAVKHKPIDSTNLENHSLNAIVQGLAFEMLETSVFVSHKTPIAMASFVNLNDLESTSWLGNLIAESFIYEFQRHGLIVIDYKATGFFRVTSEGDFVFSRDWKELPENQIIDYVVTGTLLEQKDGFILNARMIGMISHVVVATAQTFIPRWAIGEMLLEEQLVEGDMKTDKPVINKNDKASWIEITN